MTLSKEVSVSWETRKLNQRIGTNNLCSSVTNLLNKRAQFLTEGVCREKCSKYVANLIFQKMLLNIFIVNLEYVTT